MTKLEEILERRGLIQKEAIKASMKEYAEFCCEEQKLISIHTFNPYMSIDDVKNLIKRTPTFKEDDK